MILIIRISGLVENDKKLEETLSRMRLRRKYSAILIHSSDENKKLLQKIRNYIAYGPIDKETLKLLIEKRAKSIDKKKVDAEKILEHIDKKSMLSLGLKPYFRLHPPRGGIDSKIHFGKKKGVLGDNKEKINYLVRRML